VVAVSGASPQAPSVDAVSQASQASPVVVGPHPSAMADREELIFREEIEAYPEPLQQIPAFIERKELRRKLQYALARSGLEPAGTVVELGAGICWLSAVLAGSPGVTQVFAVEFSRRRLLELAPIALAYLNAPASKVKRIVGDFYAPGLEHGFADMVFTDASFHHAADPIRLARVAWDLLRPGGHFVLFREPTLALLRRSRDHGIEGQYGSFEREYTARGYLSHLSAAGFKARKVPAAPGFSSPRARLMTRPPLCWLNGVWFSEYTYVGHKTG
jgi:SAM-dependent methyltransferase